MFCKDPFLRAGRWRGFFISGLLHALLGLLIVFAARYRHGPSNGNLYRDTIAAGSEATMILWDDPVTVTIHPIAAARTNSAAASNDPPMLKPISATPLPPRPDRSNETANPNDKTEVRPAQYTPETHAPIRDPQSATPGSPPPPAASDPGAGPGGSGPARPGVASRLPGLGTAGSIVFVVDRSASMGIDDRLQTARKEIVAALSRMPAGTRFQVVIYNRSCETLILGGRQDLVSLTPQSLREMDEALGRLTPEGGNDHLPAIKAAMWLHPDVICLLTDADDFTLSMVQAITQLNRGQSVIHAVVLGSAPRTAMQVLAKHNRGTCREIDP